MEERLPLTPPAEKIARFAMPLNLSDVAADGLPAPSLAPILFWHTAPHVIAAIPLEPTARVIAVDPAFGTPNRQWLARIHPEKIERTIARTRRELGARKPALGKLLAAIRHILAAKYLEPKH